ncbi:MAG: radical SAM protein [Desulfocapsaceae bacterium]|nr:radical SAM protein [Desulfocapsaceae bacterium]
MIHPETIPSLVVADKDGTISDIPSLSMAGMSNGQYIQPDLADLIPLPEGSELFVLPGRIPVGYDQGSRKLQMLDVHPYARGRQIQAVAAFMAPAHTAILTSAYKTVDVDAPVLPLFAYAAVGWHKGRFWATAFRSDPDIRQDSRQFKQSLITRETKKKMASLKGNRLVQHLGKCCLTYGCPAARNYFLGRWEAPLPTSPVCNARCVGCISLQASGCCRSTQDRIGFIPSPAEIAEIAVPHLQKASKAIVSFGQGCEGEPLLQCSTIEKAIQKIRRHTSGGTINLNSNSSLPDAVSRLAHAGLDSLRVSLNSAQTHYYNAYYRPVNYCFEDVRESIRVMKNNGRFVSLNYFIFPGLTDSEDETAALFDLLGSCRPDLIQLRNLNMDPEWYSKALGLPPNEKRLGIRAWLQKVKDAFPCLRLGYYNPPLNSRRQMKH